MTESPTPTTCSGLTAVPAEATRSCLPGTAGVGVRCQSQRPCTSAIGISRRVIFMAAEHIAAAVTLLSARHEAMARSARP